MRDLKEHYRFRGELAARLQRDVLGPVFGEEEILTEEPATAYITGVLYPAGKDRDPKRSPTDEPDQDAQTELLAEEDIDLAPSTLTVDEMPDTGVAMANRQMPSAMGITFAVDPAVSSTVTVRATAAFYQPINEQGEVVRAQRSERRGTDEKDKLRWRRRPVPIQPVEVEVDKPGSSGRALGEGTGLQLRLTVREPDRDGNVAITATLVNVKTAGRQDLLDAHCFFQPTLHVGVPGGKTALVERALSQGTDEGELLISRLLHRHAPMFATGHGCTADWEWTPPSPRGLRSAGRAAIDAVWTAFVPNHEVLLTDSNPDVDEPGMLWLAQAPTSDIMQRLDALVTGYREWIAHRTDEAEALQGTEFGQAAHDQLTACLTTCRRMESGIARLREDPVVLKAFRLANEAMASQRARTAWMRSRHSGGPDLNDGRWRPFQIGFLLLCLDGIADKNHDDRKIADLLWFPTGGGKTEAYLGLIALTTFLRRLRKGVRGGGVTVLMRYTLRLLTLQQFERAATLVCAMELMRDGASGRLGHEPISIGMWVGRAATPNTLADAQESLDLLRGKKKLQEKNPVQLRSCPWCGTPLDYRDYHVDLDTVEMSINCRNQECEFRSGLPVHVVDETIYATRPTLIIATADKFAQITWRAQVARLFNREGAPEGTRPPELVIQDELHLISGPLGTLAGLYETAIDIAAALPKVIASTATIRRAQEQGTRLFDRTVQQFPPAGLDSRDSWFAVEATAEAKASRMYVGLLTPSTSQATLLIRAYSALLHHAALIEGDDRVRDAYWTLVGYFNSLRLLSAAELQVHADVDERLKQLANRDKASPRTVEILRELTSRVDSGDIPKYLQELFTALPDEAAIDVVLATNMISVGVDVDRLGLMAIMGQPQTTAEYIQSTSRVGRRDPGLVVALLNSARSRDRSHYENFISYHSALYRQVESTSVTPFAARARDRALHAVLVGLARLMYPTARPNNAAGRVADFEDDLQNLKEDILVRVKAIAPDEYAHTRDELDEFIAGWMDLADGNPLLYEADRKKWPGQIRKPDAALLSAYGHDEDLEDSAPTMWSLRDVDVESDLYLEN
jgi:hypothetical protein